MRLTIHFLGVEVFDIAVNESDAVEPEEVDPRGDVVSYPIGYAPSPQPDWEKPLNRYDEPSEGDEGT